jgi:hypothetical protein
MTARLGRALEEAMLATAEAIRADERSRVEREIAAWLVEERDAVVLGGSGALAEEIRRGDYLKAST